MKNAYFFMVTDESCQRLKKNYVCVCVCVFSVPTVTGDPNGEDRVSVQSGCVQPEGSPETHSSRPG